MIDANEIEMEIKRLESEPVTYQNCSKLSVLYIVRDHLAPAKLVGYSQASSEFMQVCAQVPIEDVLNVLDEHMECIKLLYPKEYSAILKKIRK